MSERAPGSADDALGPERCYFVGGEASVAQDRVGVLALAWRGCRGELAGRYRRSELMKRALAAVRFGEDAARSEEFVAE